MLERDSTYGHLHLPKVFTPDQYLERRRAMLKEMGLKPAAMEDNLAMVRRDLAVVARILELPQPSTPRLGVGRLAVNQEWRQALWR